MKRVVALLVVVLFVGLVVRTVRQGRIDKQLQSLESLTAVAGAVNEVARVPIVVAEGVELMKVTAEEGFLHYNYRLLAYDGRNVNVTKVRDDVLKAACADTTVRRHILPRGVGLKLNVHDKYGLKATTFAVLPNSC